jgi:hypothetical protein
MEAKDAGIGAAVAVLLAILGLIIMVGLILLMMWKQPGIEHSPSQQSSFFVPGPAAPVSLELQLLRGAPVTQCGTALGGEA